MTISEAIEFLEGNISDKKSGLPDDIFYFISRTTPLVNVDLLVKDKNGRVLLAWRDDEYYGQGWHIPGSIVRFKETLEQRIQRCAKRELGVNISYDPEPLAIEQNITPEWENRAHFISFLYRCSVPEGFVPDNSFRKEYSAGYLRWHEKCPDNFLRVQDCYRKFMNWK
jgi:colanic acid biosynthesis protein WcaH